MRPEVEAETVEAEKVEVGLVVVEDSRYGTRPVVGRVLSKYGTNPAVVGVVIGSTVGLDNGDDPVIVGVDTDDDGALHLQNLLGGFVGAGESGASVGLLGGV